MKPYLWFAAQSMIATAFLVPNAAAAQPVPRSEVSDVPIVLASALATPPVSKDTRRLILAKPKGPIPAEVVLRSGDGGGTITLLERWRGGWLVGTNNGEWGGSLYLAIDGTKTRLTAGNIIGSFMWGGHLYVLEGLQHLGLDNGNVVEVDLANARVTRVIPLPAMPADLLVTNDNMIVVRTGKGDVSIAIDGTIKPI